MPIKNKPKRKYTKRTISKFELKTMMEREAVQHELDQVNAAYEISKKVWSDQEERMLNRIQNLHTRLELNEKEKQNLLEVIEALGELLGENKGEIKRLKTNMYFSNELNLQAMEKPKL